MAEPVTKRLPSISIGQGIAWGFSAPYEDTNTLVLTSPDGRFVDVRFPRSFNGQQEGDSYITHPAFWAFSGLSTSTQPQQGDFPAWPYAAHSEWTHEIDSRGPGIVDEGDMFDLPNGDCMEVGVMTHPQTGEPSMYKELWTSPKLSPEYGIGLFPCFVADVVSSSSSRRGRIVRVGPHCQGIVESATSAGVVEVERWTYRLANGQHRWVRDEPVRHDFGAAYCDSSEATSPYGWLLADQRRVGDEMAVGQERWRVVEACRE